MKAVTCGRVVVGDGTVVDGPSVVLVDGKRIAAVGSADRVEIPEGAEIVDAGDRTVIPGLMDCHLHMTQWNVKTFDNYRVAAFETSPQLQMLYTLLHAQMCLEMGFTTLRDLGGNGYAGPLAAELVAVRDAIDLGIHAGPRLLVAGFTIATGSHLDLIMPRNAPRVRGATADGPWGLRELARTHLRTGVDLLKTCASGGGGTDKEEPDVRNMTQAELDAIADEAHAANKRCACHAFTPEAQKMAMRAGVDSLEHCVFTDDEAVERMLELNKPLVPTLAHRSDRAIEQRRGIGTPTFVIEKMKRIQPVCWATFQRLHEAGVTMAMGTDTQLDPGMGDNAYELEIYVGLGMTPAEALATATRNAAGVLGLGDEIGTLEAGKFADLVAVSRNPLDDITVLQERESIELVVKEGEVLVDRRPGHPRRGVVARDAWDWDKPC